MFKEVIHQTYCNGLTFDVSQNGNHGRALLATPGSSPLANTFHFGVGGSRIDVKQSKSLQNLYSIRVTIRFYLTPYAKWHRFNLMEGHLSFALFIERDGSIMGTILGAGDIWVGAKSSPGLVSVNNWHIVEMVHDGVSQCQLLLDGTLVAAAFDAAGPVRSVGAEGLVIGHWPGQSSNYTFEGNIGEVQLFKYDPIADFSQYFQPCCPVDGRVLDQILIELRSHGWTSDRCTNAGYELLSEVSRYAAAIRNGDSQQTAAHKAVGFALQNAMLHRDTGAYAGALERALTIAKDNLSDAEISKHNKDVGQLLNNLPLSADQYATLAKALCFDFLLDIDGRKVVDNVRRQHKSKKAPSN